MYPGSGLPGSRVSDPGRGNREYQNGDLVRWYKSKMTRIEDGVDEAMDAAGEFGKELGQQYISTRGTGREWTRPGPSGRDASTPGRVDSGKMRDAFGFRKTTQGNSRQLRIGWVSGTREDYFQFQETGFTHFSGIDVPGMYALQDATEAAMAQLMQDLKRKVKDA